MTMEFERKTHKRRRWGKSIEWASYERKIVVGDEFTALLEEVRGIAAKNPVTTPQDIAAKFDVRVSVAKDMLKILEEEGVIRRVINGHRLRAYGPV